uniref:Peptidase S1 domain-containing protein n=1 Tax=Heliothis virescens TaxID=7102 RepID=A0A2A4JNN7_HELVI
MYSFIIYLCLSVITVHGGVLVDIEERVYEGFRYDPVRHGFMVLLGKLRSSSPEDYKDSCTGSILDENWVISAGHCFLENVTDVPIIQRIRRRERRVGYVLKRDIHMHPRYIESGEAWQYDLALLKTQSPIQFDAYAKPIALAWSTGSGQKALFGGYGHSELGSGIPLMGTAVLEDECLAPFSRPGGAFFCTRSSSQGGPGDSGGPLFTNEGLIGIMLGGEPDIRESLFLDLSLQFYWIEKVSGLYPLHSAEVYPDCLYH